MSTRYFIKAPPGPQVHKAALWESALAVEVEKRLTELGIVPAEVRLEGSDQQQCSWHFYWNDRLSVFARLYRFRGDGKIYLFMETAFGGVANPSEIPYAISSYLLRENAHMPDAIRLGLDENSILVSQVRAPETLVQFAAASYLLKLTITVADNALKNLNHVPGFVGLSEVLTAQRKPN